MTEGMTLRGNLLLLVAGTVVPLIALALVLGYVLVEHEKETTRDGAVARTRALMTAVDAELNGHILTLQGLATVRSLERDDLRAFQDEMQRFLASQPDWRLILLSAPSGIQVASTTPGFVPGRAASDPEGVRRVVEARTAQVGNVILGRMTGEYGVPVRVPVLRNGQVAYLLTADIKPAAFARLIVAQDLPEGWGAAWSTAMAPSSRASRSVRRETALPRAFAKPSPRQRAAKGGSAG